MGQQNPIKTLFVGNKIVFGQNVFAFLKSCLFFLRDTDTIEKGNNQW